MKPLVTVIIPCLNYGNFLGECLDSVFSQTYKNLEIIVIDDNSIDNTGSVAAKYGVKCIQQKITGLPAGRNEGVSIANGEFIQPLDADDRLAPTSIERCLNHMADADVVCPGQQEFGLGSHFYHRQDKHLTLNHFLDSNRIHCASLFRRKAWEEIGGYDNSMVLGYEDWDFWVRMVAKGYRIRLINEPLFFYRVHLESLTFKMTKPNHQNIIAYMAEKYSRLGIPMGGTEIGSKIKQWV